MVHDPWGKSYPGIIVEHDLETVLLHADAVVVFTGHSQYRNLDPQAIRKLCGVSTPVIVNGRNVIDPDTFIRNGFVYKGIGRRDKDGHGIVED